MNQMSEQNAVRAGFRRLYDAVGCGLVNGEDLKFRFSLGHDYVGHVYFGPRPAFGIGVMEDSQKEFLFPGAAHRSRLQTYADATQSTYPRNFFCEIVTSIVINVPEGVMEVIATDTPELQAELQRLAHQHRDELVNAADLVAGLIGLQVQPQFLQKLVNENDIVLRPGNPVVTWYGPGIELLDLYSLNETGVERLERLLTGLGTAQLAQLEFAGKVFGWLMRAWSERDIVYKFVALFVPLEMILDGTPPPEAVKKRASAIRRLIKQHGAEQKQELIAFLDQTLALYRPSLADRFEALAKQSQLPRWEADVAAFHRFNKIRNSLVHRGEAQVTLAVSLEEKDLWTLEDIVERYVSVVLLGSGEVYASRWRPSR